jgi:asparagine synthase (glutamine-hydrolysing)
MCGIGGCVLGRGARPEHDRLIAMRDALAHRGPDDFGIETMGNVALVHTRLSIVDLSERGHQPMRHPSGRWWLAYNGEIYNHLALRAELNGTPFVGDSDTETLLWALDHWGPAAVSRLTGQFAFAALDVDAGRLLLCRDRFGVKPLYFARFAGGVWFASEPAALVAAGAPAAPVDTAWRQIAAGSYLRGESTLIEGITRVAPGAWASISTETSEITHSHWHLPSGDVDRVRAAGLNGRSRYELTNVLEGTLREAVHGSLLADTTVGTLCSGGVDSSLITALAAEVQPGLVAFGASYTADPRMDEGPAAQRVAKALGVDLELVDVTPADFRRMFVPATVHYGVPIANASAVTVAQLADRARERGVKVLLTGEGADELFGGYGDLHASALAAFLPWHGQVVHHAETMMLEHPLRDPVRVLRRIKHMLGLAVGRRHSVSRWMPEMLPGTGHDPSPESTAAYAHHAGDRGRLEAGLLTRLDYTLCWLLNRMDKNVMQESVEARVPFLEPEVVKLVLNLPLEHRVGPWSKGILRDVARRVLPLSIAHRPKIYGMDFDCASWIHEGADPSFLTDGLLREKLHIPAAEFKEAMGATHGLPKLRLWSAEVWCRSVLAGQSIQESDQAIWR